MYRAKLPWYRRAFEFVFRRARREREEREAREELRVWCATEGRRR